MANIGLHNTKLGCCTLFMIVLTSLLSHQIVEGTKTSSTKNTETLQRKGTVKTIEVNSEGGDVVDCVDIYQQPAFNHPSLKNHTIEMKPSSIPTGVKQEFYEAAIRQSWHENEECPEGTIPILRTQKDYYKNPAFLGRERTGLGASLAALKRGSELAFALLYGGRYYGAQASLNVWNPTINKGDATFSQIWVYSRLDDPPDLIEAGWLVDPDDKKTKFFIYWATGAFKRTRCFNLGCAGFVQVNNKFSIGGALDPVSQYDGIQKEIYLAIYKNNASGHWWLQLQDQPPGYWPDSLFLNMSDYCAAIAFGGEVYNSEPGGRHTTTQMGSGHFPVEGPGKACYIRDIRYLDDTFIFKDPGDLKAYTTKHLCYDLHVSVNGTGNYGLYFGGPGYSDFCPY